MQLTSLDFQFLEISIQSNGAEHQKVNEVALPGYTNNRSAERSSGNMISEMDQFGSQSGILVNVSWNRPTSSRLISRELLHSSRSR